VLNWSEWPLDCRIEVRAHLGIRTSCLASTSPSSRRQSWEKDENLLDSKIAWRSDHISSVSRISHQSAFQRQSPYSAPAGLASLYNERCAVLILQLPYMGSCWGVFTSMDVFISVGCYVSGIEWLGPGEQILNPTGSSRINFRAILVPEPPATTKGC
jgi:hypothetical protein